VQSTKIRERKKERQIESGGERKKEKKGRRREGRRWEGREKRVNILHIFRVSRGHRMFA
jgi:hypothetical protein